MDDLFDERPGLWVSEAELLEMERDRQAHARPNEYEHDPFDSCSASQYLTHSFSVLDPAGHRCKYCGRRWRDCLKVS